MRSEREVNQTIDKYADTVKRICVLHLKNTADTEDVFQEVFLKYALSSVDFENEEHEKAWIIRVTVNSCHDTLKNAFRKRTVSIDELPRLSYAQNDEFRDVREAVISLPKKYRDIVYLHYYEGYTAAEIGEITGKNTNTVYTMLARARDKLKASLEGEDIG